MRSVLIRYGASRVDLTVPASIEVVTAEAPDLPPADDVLGTVAAALDAPIGTRPLAELAAEARTVAVVVPDGTRSRDTRTLLLPVLSRLARAGRLPNEIRLVMARGIHPPTSRADVERILGRDLLSGLSAVQSAPESPELNESILAHPRLGDVRIHRQVAGADLVVLVGTVQPHHLAGFGGGAKALVPGVAERDTVHAAHRLTLDTLVRPDGGIRSVAGSLGRNPFRRALEDVADALPATFAVNVVRSGDGRPHAVTAGEVRASHRRAAELWQAGHAAPLDADGPFDLVVAGCRAPGDADLIQCHKNLLAASRFAAPGAPILWAARAPGGPGHPAFLPWFQAGKLPRHLAALRTAFHPYGLTAYSVRRLAKDHPVHVVSEVSGDITRPMGLYTFESLQAALDHAVRKHAVRRCLVFPAGAA